MSQCIFDIFDKYRKPIPLDIHISPYHKFEIDKYCKDKFSQLSSLPFNEFMEAFGINIFLKYEGE